MKKEKLNMHFYLVSDRFCYFLSQTSKQTQMILNLRNQTFKALCKTTSTSTLLAPSWPFSYFTPQQQMISHNLYPFTISTYLKIVWCQSAYSPRFNQNEIDSTTKNFIGCFNWMLWHNNLVLKLILGWNYHALRLFIHYWAFILNKVTTC